MNSRTIHTDNEIDLTEAFALVSSGEITSKDVENYILGLLNRCFDTFSKPFRIKITEGTSPHVIHSNIKLKGSQKTKHFSALFEIESIIGNSRKISRDGTVETSHNTGKKTLKHKTTVKEFIYFETPVRININHFLVELAAERVFGQDEFILDLYHVRVKKNPAAAN